MTFFHPYLQAQFRFCSRKAELQLFFASQRNRTETEEEKGKGFDCKNSPSVALRQENSPHPLSLSYILSSTRSFTKTSSCHKKTVEIALQVIKVIKCDISS